MADNADCWKLDGEHLRLACGPLRGDSPNTFGRRNQFGFVNGLTLGNVELQRLALLSVSGDADEFGELEEAYTRGPDLIATYAASDDYPVRTRLQFHARPTRAVPGAAIQLTISAHTHVLDARPAVSVSSLTLGEASSIAFRNETAWRFAASPDATVVCVLHPEDIDGTRSRVEDGKFTARLRSPFLEKGVIRCWRLATFVLEGQPTDEQVLEVLEEFADLPLPLTT